MTKIPLSDDMAAPETRAVFAALEAAGGAACVRFVGGCVRNALMGRAISDLDLAAQLTPDETEAALAAAGLRSVPTGKAFGTITAVVDGKPFEITSLREDVETDGRRAVVRYTTDWAK
ncbi:MAG TPA: CCA tRNA nucleotidyltransferase, partial [Asticcacaulis sp.]